MSSDNGKFTGVFVNSESRDVLIEYQGQEIPIKVRELGWSVMNQLVSQSTKYTDQGEGRFDLDTYYKLYFSKAVIDSPWGPFNQQLVESFTPQFGRTLEALLPEARPNATQDTTEAEIGFFEKTSPDTSEEPQR